MTLVLLWNQYPNTTPEPAPVPPPQTGYGTGAGVYGPNVLNQWLNRIDKDVRDTRRDLREEDEIITLCCTFIEFMNG